jgi:hypothetical protein
MGTTPSIWRRLLVPQDVTLPQLHSILQVAMGWTNSHLHQFKVGDVRFAEPSDEDELPVPIDYRRITLAQIAPRRGGAMRSAPRRRGRGRVPAARRGRHTT